ncbi:hypothetical protein [Deinococcus aestuarii]|uniref:hypothetical protein n=1 Tax=Deinococcus aestuarii TaxID=2774531 RepID=UPI001C0CB860|nr:hypothetical protein [Deinococcus aestuarii]
MAALASVLRNAASTQPSARVTTGTAGSARDEHLDVHLDGCFKKLDFYNLDTHRLGGIGIDGVFDSPVTRGTADDRARLTCS